MTARFSTFLQSFVGVVLISFVVTMLAALPLVLGVERSSLFAMVPLTLSALICFIGIPFLLITKVFKVSLADFGWRLPEHPRRAVVLSLIVFLGHIAVFLPLAWVEEFQSFYGLADAPLVTLLLFLIPISAAYYFAEEFFFRGFLLNTLRLRYASLAIVLNSLIFTFLHIGKPLLELPLAFLSSLTLCWLSLTTRSFLPAAIIHWAIALFLNIVIYFASGTPAPAEFHF